MCMCECVCVCVFVCVCVCVCVCWSMDNNDNKCISNALNPTHDYTCVRLKAPYMKHYNDTRSDLIMHDTSHSIHPPPLHPHTCTPTSTHTQYHNLSLPPLSPSPPQKNDNKKISTTTTKQQQQQKHQSASEDINSKIKIKSSTGSNACDRVRQK